MNDIPEILKIWTEGKFDCQIKKIGNYTKDALLAVDLCVHKCNLTCQAEKKVIGVWSCVRSG